MLLLKGFGFHASTCLFSGFLALKLVVFVIKGYTRLVAWNCREAVVIAICIQHTYFGLGQVVSCAASNMCQKIGDTGLDLDPRPAEF